MAEIDYLVAESFNAYADSGAPLRLSGTLRERPDPEGKAGAYYFATDQGIVFESTGKTWIVRGALGKDDVAGHASGLKADMPPPGKMVGWIYHTTDTNRDYEAFPSGWYTAPIANPFTAPPGIAPDSLSQLRSSFSNQFGARFQSTSDAVTRIVMQTLDASPRNPHRVKFDQHILEEFTGDGQFDLVERDSARRVTDGVSDGSATLTSATMDWQSEDEGEIIKVGKGAGFQLFRIESVEDEQTVVLDRDIPVSATDVTLEMEGGNEVTIATKDGFTNGIDNENGWQSFSKIITTDKVYSLVCVPGDTGDGVISLSAQALVERQPAGSASLSMGDTALNENTRDAGYTNEHDATFNIDPYDMLIGGLVTASALGLIGIGIYCIGGAAIAAGGAAIGEGTIPAAIETYTVTINGVETTLVASDLAVPVVTNAEARVLLQSTLEGVYEAATAAEEAGAEFYGGGVIQAITTALADAAAMDAGTAGSIIPLLFTFDATQPPIDVNHGDHGVYLHYFVYPHGQSEGTPPGFPGFPGSGLPLGPGVFKICYSNDTPDGGPPICYFTQ